MTTFLPKIAYRKEIGLAIGDREVAVSQVALTPLGPVELVRDRIELENLADLPDAIETLLSRSFDRRELDRSTINVGLSALRIFFSTRPIQAENRETSAEILLHEVLQSATINVDDMAVDLVKIRPGLRPLASIVSCRKKYLASVMTALQACRLRPHQVEPTPCALIREASRVLRAPRKIGSFVRIFLGEHSGLAVLLAGPGLPLIWRPFPISQGTEASSIASTMNALEMLGPFCGQDAPVGAVFLHGRPDLTEIAQAIQSTAHEGVRYYRADGPSLDEGDAAKALATSTNDTAEPFNLIRSLVSPVSIRNSVPWFQVVLQCAALVLVTWFLQVRQAEHRAETRAARSEVARYQWATKLSTEKLRSEKKELEQKVEAIRTFLDTRVCWSSYSREITGLLSKDLALTTFQGHFELEGGGRNLAKPKKSLVVRLIAPIPRTGTMPKEIDEFLQSMRSDSMLKTNFGSIELADLRWTDAAAKKANAIFGVICTPMKTSPAAGSKPKAKSL